MKLKEKIESLCRHTVGYSESKSKASFMVGVSVAFDKAEEHYEPLIKHLEKQIDLYISANDALANDLYTLYSIIDRYSKND